MTLRAFLISFVIGIFFVFSTNYIFVNLSPLNLDKVQELAEEKGIEEEEWDRLDDEIDLVINEKNIFPYLTPDAYLGLVSFCLSIFCIFFSFHVVIDKIFFKKFYEKPSLYNAARRGLILVITIVAIICLKLYKVNTQTLIAVGLLGIAIELLFINFLNDLLVKSFSNQKKDKNESPKELDLDKEIEGFEQMSLEEIDEKNN